LRLLAVLVLSATGYAGAEAPVHPGRELLCANPPCAPGSLADDPTRGRAPATVTDLHTPEDARHGERVILNFQGADIATVAKAVGLITRRNFIIDPRVNGTVNIVSSEPVARDLVYAIFLSALRLQGFSAVEGTGFTKIVPEADAKLNNSPTSSLPQTATGDRIITQVIPLQFENAAQLLPVLRPLISPNNVINAYANNNTLVITDYAENMARLLKVIAAIDVAPAGELQILTLKYASALDVAGMIAKLFPEVAQGGTAPAATGQSGGKTTLTVDPRTNSLLLRGDSGATLSRVRQLVDSLDTPAAGTGNIHVVYLRNAEANKVADALHGIVSGSGSSGGNTGSSSASGSALATSPMAGAAGTSPAGGSSGTSFGNQASTVTSFSLPVSQGGGVVEAYPATNSLIIVAPDNIYNNLRAVIDKLDARRAQVYVEALVVEVTQSKSQAFGVQWQALSGLNSTATRLIGGTNFTTTNGTNIISAAGNITSIGQGLNVGVIRGTVTLPNGTQLLNLGALATFLQSESDANILSTPNLLTIDNEEAKIVVGQNVPFITGSQTTTSNGISNPFQTIERRDVGLTLRVKPTIAEGGTVKLAIYQEVSSVADSSNSAGIITNKRSIESTVLVDDGQIVVLGGLIQDSVNGSVSKVPGLGDLPLIGSLFRSDSRTHSKTNLMVFMRPVVLRDASAPAALTADRYDFIRNEQLRAQPPSVLALPDIQAPVLPPYPDGRVP
jgi:general secretion pathway protein D